MQKLLSLIVLAGATAITAWAADVPQKVDSRLEDAKNVIDQIMSNQSNSIPENIARKAECVAVVPGMKKAAFIVGGDYGQGVVTCRTANGWSAPVFIRMAGGSWGLQVGGQSTDLVLLAMNQKGFQDLLHSKFKIGAGVSAAAGPVGRDAQASTDASLRSEMLSYSRSKGAFAGIDLNGTSVTQNTDDTNALYGSGHSFDQILHGSVPSPAVVQPFLETIEKYFGAGSEHQ
jgi:SH3 domain-containing YSC84-like protein 1